MVKLGLICCIFWLQNLSCRWLGRAPVGVLGSMSSIPTLIYITSSPGPRKSCSVDSCASVQGEKASYIGFTERSNLGLSHQQRIFKHQEGQKCGGWIRKDERHDSSGLWWPVMFKSCVKRALNKAREELWMPVDFLLIPISKPIYSP